MKAGLLMMTSIVKATSSDQVIYTSLKPMSSLSLSVPVLFYDANGNAYLGTHYDTNHVICDGVVYGSKKFIGWCRVPKFKPEWMDNA